MRSRGKSPGQVCKGEGGVGVMVQVRCVRVKGGDKGAGQVCKGGGKSPGQVCKCEGWG